MTQSLRNKTMSLNDEQILLYKGKTIKLSSITDQIVNKVVCQDLFQCIPYIPNESIDLLIIDPPYNLSKKFNQIKFNKMKADDYHKWVKTKG